jgi:hypothetical protein
MTIGLTALVERYLIERRTLGFQLRPTAYEGKSDRTTDGGNADKDRTARRCYEPAARQA